MTMTRVPESDEVRRWREHVNRAPWWTPVAGAVIWLVALAFWPVVGWLIYRAVT